MLKNMENIINTNLERSKTEEVYNKDINRCLNLGEDQQWEMYHVNDVTMSDITRAVSAFIRPTYTESSTLDRTVPKKEIYQNLSGDLFSQSNSNSITKYNMPNETVGNNNLGSGSVLSNTYCFDGMCLDEPMTGAINKFENRIVHEYSPYHETVHRKVPKVKSELQTATGNHDELFGNNIAKPIIVNTHPCIRSMSGGVMFINNSAAVGNGNTADRRMEVIYGGLRLESDSTSSNMVSKATLTPKAHRVAEITQKRVPIYQNFHACPVQDCNVRVTSKAKLDMHVRINHKLEGFRCLECGKRYGTITNFDADQNFHKGIKPYNCEVCGDNFESWSLLNYHFNSRHISSNNKAQCEICGVIGSKTALPRHIKEVHLKERYPCNQCDREFRNNKMLKDHLRMHRGDEPYKCEICQHPFVQKKSMMRHFKRHSRKLECPKCDKVFKSKSFLNGHLRQHEGIKKHCCNVCGKTFVHGHYLFTHMKSHGEKCFECSICGGKFNRKDNLKSHIIRHQTTGRNNLKKK